MARNQALALVLLMILQTVSVTVGDPDHEGTVGTNDNLDTHQHDSNLQQSEYSPWLDPGLLEGIYSENGNSRVTVITNSVSYTHLTLPTIYSV